MRSKLQSVQGLRAFAALAVVHFHTQFHVMGWHTFGAFGVDIFFVISGFIMAMVCGRDTREFVRKRLIRIVPLYWLITLIVFTALVTHPNFDPAIGRGVGDLCKSLLFLPFARSDGTTFPLLVVGWTLNYEMCFYLVIALAILLSPRRWVMPVSTLLLAGLICLMRVLPQSTAASFYANFIMLEFIAGVGCFWMYEHVPEALCSRLRPALVTLIPLSIAFLVWYEATRFHLRSGNRLGLGAPAFCLCLSVVLLSKAGWDCEYPPLVRLGDASYSLYLTHTFVVSACKHLVAPRVTMLAPFRPLGMLSAMILSGLFAWGVHRFLDRPMHLYFQRFVRLRKV